MTGCTGSQGITVGTCLIVLSIASIHGRLISADVYGYLRGAVGEGGHGYSDSDTLGDVRHRPLNFDTEAILVCKRVLQGVVVAFGHDLQLGQEQVSVTDIENTLPFINYISSLPLDSLSCCLNLVRFVIANVLVALCVKYLLL